MVPDHKIIQSGMSNAQRLKAMKRAMCLPPASLVPAVLRGSADESLRTKSVGAFAGRGSLSRFDDKNRSEWNTTLRHEGYSVIQDVTKKPATCACLLSGATIVPGVTTTVLPNSMCKCAQLK